MSGSEKIEGRDAQSGHPESGEARRRQSARAVPESLGRELPGIAREAPLAPLCAYGVGGPAEYLFEARTHAELVRAVLVAQELALPLTVLGQATNVLIDDDGVRGLVVLARNSAISLDGERLTAGAGAVLPEIIGDLAQKGLAGLEFAGNIPGSVGGAVVGNAGAYGRSVGDALIEVSIVSGGQLRSALPADLALGYRTSAIKTGDLKVVIVEATFELAGGVSSKLLAEIARDAELRRGKHPLEYASCGSYFKNPSRERPAALFIEQAGLKGLTVGQAQVSPAHANFLVALPGATAADIRRLAAKVKRVVFESSGVRLEEEVTMLGGSSS